MAVKSRRKWEGLALIPLSSLLEKGVINCREPIVNKKRRHPKYIG
jgi:hypothetical protein